MLIKTEGKIYQIIRESEYFGCLVMKKRIKGMIQPLVFSIKGDVFRSLVVKREMREGDRVRIWFVPVCRKHKERYYTNLSIEKIELMDMASTNLFTQNNETIDIETGEITNE
jgi:hypothetical protein